tara:strand:- start:1613 stop:2251 length:639 start_codon:yes stop_codon:yes gene_type:complete
MNSKIEKFICATISCEASSEDLRRMAVGFQEWFDLILKWNQKINLVSKHGLNLDHHLYDSLQYAKAIPGMGRILDIGSGAGFPGVALKILWPRLDLVLLESQKKRANFLKTLARESGFGNFLVVEGRAEDVCGQAAYKEKFDVVTFKGVGNPKLCLALGGPFLKQGGILVVKQEPEQFFANSSREFRLKNEISTSGLQGLESKLMVFLKCFT